MRNIKEILIPQLAEKFSISTDVISSIIATDAKANLDAISGNVTELEIASFGTFYVSKVKMGRRKKKYEDIQRGYQSKSQEDLSEEKKKTLKRRIESVREELNHINNKENNIWGSTGLK